MQFFKFVQFVYYTDFFGVGFVQIDEGLEVINKV